MTETDAQMLQRLGADAAAWAAEFRKTAIRLGYSDMDEGWLIGWFANAIENAEMVRHPVTQSDLSATLYDMVAGKEGAWDKQLVNDTVEDCAQLVAVMEIQGMTKGFAAAIRTKKVK